MKLRLAVQSHVLCIETSDEPAAAPVQSPTIHSKSFRCLE